MSNNTHINEIVSRLENYLECWKQFNNFINLGREKKFSPEDETQFLELKSVITQELEVILAVADCGPLTREEIHSLLTSAPSLRILNEMNLDQLRNVETHWHRIYIGWQSVLGQLKVKQQQVEQKSFIGSVFQKKKLQKAVA